MTLFVNPRLDYLLHARPQCMACADLKQQWLVTSWSSPPTWRCRLCEFEYRWEPAGTPTLADAERAIAEITSAATHAFPPVSGACPHQPTIQHTKEGTR